MTNTSMTDVLIVGAGPVGLTLASDLARRGIACRIIDKSPVYPIGTRARGIRPRTLEVFEDLEVLEALLAYAEPPMPTRFYDQEGKLFREAPAPYLPPTPDVPYPGSLYVSQQYTETVLRKRLAAYGISVELDRALTGFTQHADYVVASIQHAGSSEDVQARYLVGCDGGNSTVRKCAGISFLGETREEQSILFGNLSVSGVDPSFWHIWTSLPLTLNSMPRSNTWFFTAPLVPDEHGKLPPASVETFQRIFDENVGLPGVRFYDPTYLSIYQVNIRMVDRYREGRVFLAGDAAHVHTPAGGQGMNTGIQDAYNLGWKLAHVLRGAPAALLETYQEERFPIAQHVLASTTARGEAWAGPTANPSTRAQNMEKMFQGKDPFGDVTQLSLTYQGGRLARNLDDATGLRAGDRAPDAPCLDAKSGEQVRLFDLLRGTHFTLLVFGDLFAPSLAQHFLSHLHVYHILRPGKATENGQHILIDNDGHAYRAYAIKNDALFLIRPDGYIGLSGGRWNDRVIADYLREVI
ncbi:3-(3-hydroxyphenyl)propionate hydroxylase [Ktedonosporobacter rubrisoli]|uniref:3-(3-hydroxyphenyl)propionate hydroxylase n=1 Tax=Ktedonosporobacter rubrisoli TaxID=2509675 RepID=A0A4P6JKG8_KTERU|nr:FAD-dependent monooxygenase [Ktedonosporobacter rubrisoli]QBD75470.1 3-(3-hydroxyphenyl)propionate hydroxylase [Ktedonosporobacter rubrisoli]